MTELKVVVHVEKVEGRKVYMHGKLLPLTGESDAPHAEAQALFYRMSDTDNMIPYERARQLFGPNSRLTADDVVSMLTRSKL